MKDLKDVKANRTSSQSSRNQRVRYYTLDNDKKEKIRHDLPLNEKLKGILLGIWRAGVYYIGNKIDYGHPVCDLAIKAAKELNPPQTLTYEIIKVNQSHWN